jgi:hypothetical protein
MSKVNFLIAVNGEETELEFIGNSSYIRAEIKVGPEDLATLIESMNYWWDDMAMTAKQRETIMSACRYLVEHEKKFEAGVEQLHEYYGKSM